MLPTVRVRLLDVPVALFCAAERHTDDLLREIALMAAARADLQPGHLFSEVLATADTYAHRPVAVRHRMAEAVTLARSAGWDSVTVEVDADETTAAGAIAWEELLRQFDDMSREERLLTLPAPPAVAAYRAWYVNELVDQVRTGREPVSWTRARHLTMAGSAT